ncbi:tetratricopeptide repeat protein [uncultured Microscilla sp.]|uniref:tetratricopeptide repeat protein n=1 Tax=uncultured Microscilla sp. TaxID=432653 RepID=UPI00262E5CDC|nr:tetratricopeptide repeat protein [uncultured Microscilla sp.]
MLKDKKLTAFFAFFFTLSYIGSQVLFAQSANTYLSQGKAKSEAGAYAQAIQDFTKAINLNSHSDDAYHYRGEAYFRVRRYVKALADFNKAIEIDPRQSSASYHLRGLVKYNLKLYKQAIADYNQAIKIAYSDETYFVDRAKAFLELKRYKKALKDCNAALKISKTYAYALSVRGLVKAAQGNRQAASEDLKAAIQNAKNDPKEYMYRNYLGDFYRNTRQTTRAIEEYSAAIHLNPRNTHGLYNRSLLRLTLGNYDKALEDAHRTILNNRRFVKAYAVRGIAKRYSGVNQEAQMTADLQKYLRSARKATDYHYISWLLFEHSHKNKEMLTEAKKWALKSVKLENNFTNNLLCANILFDIGETPQALKYANTAMTFTKSEGLSKAKTLAMRIGRNLNDIQPPVIRISTPLAANNNTRGVIVVAEDKKITIAGQVTDESGVASVLINGNPARLDHSGNFDGVTVLEKAENLVKVRATDKRGNSSTQEFVVKRKVKAATPISKKKGKENLILGTHRALLVATNEYTHWDNLMNPVYDAKAIAKDLKEIYGFEIDLLLNPTKDEIVLKLRSYAKKQYENNDELFIFFAGHGQFDEVFKEGYLVTKDSKLNDESKSSYISHSNLRTYINNINCKHVFLMMDVCFGGTFDPLIASRGMKEHELTKSRAEYVNRKLRYKTRRYLTSGGKEYVPDGRAGSHSPFARRFLTALRSEGGENGILSIAEILKFVQTVTPNPRSGEFGSNEPGSEFLFVVR